MLTKTSLHHLRDLFPMLRQSMHGKPLVYLDSGATSLKPQEVIDSEMKFYSQEYGTVHRAVYDLAAKSTLRYNQVREKVAQFIHASRSEEIVFTKGTTEAINLVAQTYGREFLQDGDEVILSAMEHHSNIVPWQLICKEKNAHIKVIPVSDKGELDLSAYRSLLSNKTKIVAVNHVSNVLGSINPVKEITDLAHEIGAVVVVDGAQAIGHLPVDVQELGADFYAFSGHKMYGPTGIGVLYGKWDLLNMMPPWQGGGDMIDQVDFQKTTFSAPPTRFEAGTPNIAAVMGLGAAIDFLQSIGMDVIYEHEVELLEFALKEIETVPGVHIYGEANKRTGVISFTVDSCHPLDLGTLLDFKGVAVRTGHHCAQPLMKRFSVTSMLRASLGVYSNKDDLLALKSALIESIQSL